MDQLTCSYLLHERWMSVVKLNININDETEAALKELAARRGITVTETVRRAVAVYKFIEDEKDAGGKLQVIHEGGTSTSVAIV